MAEDDTGPDASAPGGAMRWLDAIKDAERYFQEYQDKSDSIDKLYADLEKLGNTSREREMQVFWANLEVLKPSIYARPPVPVVVPRFKNRQPLALKTAELLERALISSFSTEDIDATMRLIRDDLAVAARGVAWMRLDETDGAQKVRFDHIKRKDFLHEPGREWSEVGWVARRAYLNRKNGRERFGKVFMMAEFKERQEDDNEREQYRGEPKAQVWEIWDRNDSNVIWVTPGIENALDLQSPYLSLEGFFPCPRPAYGTVQRGTLKPIPEFLYYKDQIEEINELTARISSLSEALRIKGFYPAGSGDLSEAVETAMKSQNNNAILIPVSNFAALGAASLKDSVVWLPTDQVSKVVGELVQLRKQLIDDVYQVTGLSDIMRGSTEASETATAQRLKSQYGSIRIRDRQQELVRIARDMTRMAAEIMAENFSPKTLLSLSQMGEELPPAAIINQQVAALRGQQSQIAAKVEELQGDPRVQQMAQSQPQKAQQIVQAVKQQMAGLEAQIKKAGETVTVEKVIALLRSERARPFVLDIETDSTIQPDEDAQKQRATEFVTAVGGFMAQALPLVKEVPQSAELAAAMLKFVAGQFRAGRELNDEIEKFADEIAQAGSQPKPPSPEVQAAQASMQLEQERAKIDAQAKQQDAQIKDGEAKTKQAVAHMDAKLKVETAQHAAGLAEKESAAKIAQTNAKMQQEAQTHEQAMQKGALEVRISELAIVKLTEEIKRLTIQAANDVRKTDASIVTA